MNEDDETCTCERRAAPKHGLVVVHEPHPCPYQEEINDDHEFRCDCCPACTQECRWDI
jgi:hypothetical protein